MFTLVSLQARYNPGANTVVNTAFALRHRELLCTYE